MNIESAFHSPYLRNLSSTSINDDSENHSPSDNTCSDREEAAGRRRYRHCIYAGASLDAATAAMLRQRLIEEVASGQEEGGDYSDDAEDDDDEDDNDSNNTSPEYDRVRKGRFVSNRRNSTESAGLSAAATSESAGNTDSAAYNFLEDCSNYGDIVGAGGEPLPLAVAELSAAAGAGMTLAARTTANGSPLIRKTVRFADDCGLILENIRVMTEPSDYPPMIPLDVLKRCRRASAKTARALLLTAAQRRRDTPSPVLPSSSHSLSSSSNISSTAVACSAGAGNGSQRQKAGWRMTFKQPASDYVKFRNAFQQQKVILENIFVRNEQSSMVGTVKVANIVYEKSVYIRLTTDGWKTFTDHQCKYQSSTSPSSDAFRFEIDLPKEGKQSKAPLSTSNAIEFCVCFVAGGGHPGTGGGEEYWDSNSGKNYLLVRDQANASDPVASAATPRFRSISYAGIGTVNGTGDAGTGSIAKSVAMRVSQTHFSSDTRIAAPALPTKAETVIQKSSAAYPSTSTTVPSQQKQKLQQQEKINNLAPCAGSTLVPAAVAPTIGALVSEQNSAWSPSLNHHHSTTASTTKTTLPTCATTAMFLQPASPPFSSYSWPQIYGVMLGGCCFAGAAATATTVADSTSTTKNSATATGPTRHHSLTSIGFLLSSSSPASSDFYHHRWGPDHGNYNCNGHSYCFEGCATPPSSSPFLPSWNHHSHQQTQMAAPSPPLSTSTTTMAAAAAMMNIVGADDIDSSLDNNNSSNIDSIWSRKSSSFSSALPFKSAFEPPPPSYSSALSAAYTYSSSIASPSPPSASAWHRRWTPAASIGTPVAAAISSTNSSPFLE